MIKNRYNHLNEYLKNRFGERILKVCIDGGFTCPNRDGTSGYGGCIFCGEEGAGDLIKGKCSEVVSSIRNQINTFLNSYRGERANKFIAYFQSFSNTYDSIENLKLKYDTALESSDKFIGLEIATRPDLINDEIINLLKSYKSKYYVCVELGLQTADDNIGKIINRRYSSEDFIRACDILRKNDIDIVAHIMVGLPNESKESILDTVRLINNCGCNGVKIHSTYVLKNTRLEKMLYLGEYNPINMEYYIDCVCDIVANLHSDIIIHRINADPPKDKLIAPDWTSRKKVVLNEINKRLDELDITQGCASK